jgi:hypothetical protein
MNVCSDLSSISLVYFIVFCFQGRMAVCMLASDEVTRKISDTTLRKLFIGNLSQRVTNGMLYNYFKGHGDIEECSVVYHKDSKKSR